mgnify:CR=1 FL=1
MFNHVKTKIRNLIFLNDCIFIIKNKRMFLNFSFRSIMGKLRSKKKQTKIVPQEIEEEVTKHSSYFAYLSLFSIYIF